jgi:hypothetical protein
LSYFYLFSVQRLGLTLGEVQQDRQAEIMKHLKLSSNVDNKETVRIVKELIDKMARAQLDNPIKQSPVLGDRL